MLLHQGALAFETWTGQAAPLDAMRRALGDAGLPLGTTPPAKGH
jgi:shikimate 5-dehydrogenase